MTMPSSDQEVFNQAVAQAQNGQRAAAYQTLASLNATYPFNTDVLLWLAFSSESSQQAYDALLRLQSVNPQHSQLASAWNWYHSRFVTASPNSASSPQSYSGSESRTADLPETDPGFSANLPPDLQYLLGRALGQGERILYAYPRQTAESQTGWTVLTNRRYYRLFQGKFFNAGDSWIYAYATIHPQAFHFGYAKSGKVTLKLAGKDMVKYSKDGSIEPDVREKWQESVATFASLADAFEFCQLLLKVYQQPTNESRVAPDMPASIVPAIAKINPSRRAILTGLLAPNERVLVMFHNFSILGAVIGLIFTTVFVLSFGIPLQLLVANMGLGWAANILLAGVALLVFAGAFNNLCNPNKSDELILTNGRMLQLSDKLVKVFPLDRSHMKIKVGGAGRGKISIENSIVDDCFYEEYGASTGIFHYNKVDLSRAVDVISQYGTGQFAEVGRTWL